MRLIFGGQFQGKYAFAQEKFPCNYLNGKNCNFDDIFTCEGIYNFENFVKNAVKNNLDLSNFIARLTNENPNIIIVSSEVGGGVVPLDPFERVYRENVGRLCTQIAQFSSEVYRVTCGIATCIKSKG